MTYTNRNGSTGKKGHRERGDEGELKFLSSNGPDPLGDE